MLKSLVGQKHKFVLYLYEKKVYMHTLICNSRIHINIIYVYSKSISYEVQLLNGDLLVKKLMYSDTISFGASDL